MVTGSFFCSAAAVNTTTPRMAPAPAGTAGTMTAMAAHRTRTYRITTDMEPPAGHYTALLTTCYAVLALAARQTTRLRLGPGTAICGARIPPVQVAAIATLNRLAPGRVHLAVGTGNTAMRTMGQRPMRIAEYDDYLRVLSAPLRGEVQDYGSPCT